MTQSTAEPIVRARDVRRTFGGRAVLGGIALELQAGEFVALLGPSGCGKNTFLRALAALDPLVTGELNLPERRSMVFQEPRLLPWKRVWKNVTLGMSGNTRSVETAPTRRSRKLGSHNGQKPGR